MFLSGIQVLVLLEVALSLNGQSWIHAVSCTSCENHSFILVEDSIALSLSLSLWLMFFLLCCVFVPTVNCITSTLEM